MPRIQRALISVYDKEGIVDLARLLQEMDVEILSTGGTARHLEEHGLRTRAISDITEFPEILGGRVKTLHPRIFGGILALRQDAGQAEESRQHDLPLIDLVVVNLYPFEQTVAREGVTLEEALENIDIGGPSLIRAAAKNHASVAVVTAPQQYPEVMTELQANGGVLSPELRRRLALEAFTRTAHYDLRISQYLSGLDSQPEPFPDRLVLALQKVQDLRYGENPHQRGAFYRERGERSGLAAARQLHGKQMSFNNILDAEAALAIVQAFSEPCAVVVKHTNPCGVGVGGDLLQAYQRAKSTDPVSAFGGIVGVNRPLDADTARAISELFTEVVLAPEFTEAALRILKEKKNLRLVVCADIDNSQPRGLDLKRVRGGLLVQDRDGHRVEDLDLKVVTKRQPTEAEWAALRFAWRVVKWVKSNAVIFTAGDRTLGIGAGQMSRVDASEVAIAKARRMRHNLKGSVAASDAFYPFRDGVDVAAEAGATAVIQPGGSIRDEEVIGAADEHDMAMVFTGVRHFRH